MTRSHQQVSVPPDDLQDQVLAACGYQFTIAPDNAVMPDSIAMPARAPVAAELCDIPVQVTLAESPPLSDLDIGPFGAYRFDASRDTVWIRRPALDAAWQNEALHGPVLLHALAQHGVFVLHASAVRTPGGHLVALTADSGVGKSTLARVAADKGWQRVADDLLPIAKRGKQIVALPHLPQPKLANTEQYPATAASALPLAALMQLARGPTPAMDRLSAAKAGGLLLCSTVATRVFATESLTSHLAFAARLTEEVIAGRILVGRMTVADLPNDIGAAAVAALEVIVDALTEVSPQESSRESAAC